MKDRHNTVFGLTYTLQAPANIQEALDICGGEEEVLLEHFTQKLIYNHHNAQVRSNFCEALENATGIARKEDEEGNNTYQETETEYVNRVCAEEGKTLSEYLDLLQQVANETPLTGLRRTRASSGGAKLAKTYLEAAQQIAAAGALEKAAEMLERELEISVPATEGGVARALKEREDRRRKEFAENLKAFLQ